MTNEELLNSVALYSTPGIGRVFLLELYKKLGSSTAIIKEQKNIRDIIPYAHSQFYNAFLQLDQGFKRAEIELEFSHKHSISIIGLNDYNYPDRLRQCPDPPFLLFYKGATNLNARNVLSVVGTRHITEYGKDLCASFIKELSQEIPDLLIISGLAYGVDIHAHRAALTNHLPTIGVLAHGLDRIYPSSHRETAKEMLNNGGLITEYMSMTQPDKGNFVQRNRIIAGMSDACIIMESAQKGGALITANIASDYGRDVFAFPGRINDSYSIGCNNLIRDEKAKLITSGKDFIKLMNWDKYTKKIKPVQPTLFPELNKEEQCIFQLLKGSEGKQINQLTIEANIPVQKTASILFGMEMKGIVRVLAGGRYRLRLG